MNEDLVVALENAIERGSSLQDAKSSLINAGYPLSYVEEASHYVHSGVLPMMQRIQPSQPAKIEESHSGNLKVIILVIILVVLLGALVFSIFKKDAISEYITTLFS